MTTMRFIGLFSAAATLAAPLAAQSPPPEILACYDSRTGPTGTPQGSGIMYRIKVPGVVGQQGCVDPKHTQFSWTARHGALTGLTADDHPQYILADGVRATTNGFAVKGTLGTGTIPFEGAGVRLMWYPGKAAFRAGTVGGIHWNDENIGLYSTAMGVGTIASGEGATALGLQTQATGEGSTALGHSTSASGFGSTALGVTNVASGFGSAAMGSSNVASGSFSTAMGRLASTNLKTGSFVYGDAASPSLVNATVDNSFVVRAQNVWFGRSGDQPTSPAGYFTADGVIASTTGGFKFPDGTVQTTAATGTSSELRHARSENFAVPPGGSVALTVTWTTPFADANYTATCSLEAGGVVGVFHAITVKTSTHVTVIVSNDTAGFVSIRLVECIAIHD